MNSESIRRERTNQKILDSLAPLSDGWPETSSPTYRRPWIMPKLPRWEKRLWKFLLRRNELNNS